MDQLSEEIELSSQSLYHTLAILNNDTYSPGIDSEGGIEEVLGRRAWIILVHNVEKTWNMRIRHIWLQTLLLLLVLHPGLCILGEILWLYTFEPFSAR
ncbi:hypothetical protein LENED_004780 [Lentinula edodes]|uniref:Uncharacterized protein n=1 Tax=Lentinula edodes TaxID=5353 RepID=A0A1Q3E779_LENED|nr:hypothetical protein LENED_004780 [Lentinula edodes]